MKKKWYWIIGILLFFLIIFVYLYFTSENYTFPNEKMYVCNLDDDCIPISDFETTNCCFLVPNIAINRNFYEEFEEAAIKRCPKIKEDINFYCPKPIGLPPNYLVVSKCVNNRCTIYKFFNYSFEANAKYDSITNKINISIINKADLDVPGSIRFPSRIDVFSNDYPLTTYYINRTFKNNEEISFEFIVDESYLYLYSSPCNTNMTIYFEGVSKTIELEC